MVLKGLLTFLVILAVPARDTFNFVLDLASYPNLVSYESSILLYVFLTADWKDILFGNGDWHLEAEALESKEIGEMWKLNRTYARP